MLGVRETNIQTLSNDVLPIDSIVILANYGYT